MQRKASFLAWFGCAAIAVVVALLMLLLKAGGGVGGDPAETDAWVPLASVAPPGAGAETTVAPPASTGPSTSVAVTVTEPPTTVAPPASTGPPTSVAVTVTAPPTTFAPPASTGPPTTGAVTTNPPTTSVKAANPPTSAPRPTSPPTTAPPPTSAPTTTTPAVIVPNAPPGASPPGPGAGGSGATGPGWPVPSLWLALPVLLLAMGALLWGLRWAPSGWPPFRSLAVGWHRHVSRRLATLGRPASPSPPAPRREGGWKPQFPGTNGLAAGRAPRRFGIDVSGLRSVPPPDKPVFTGWDGPDLPV